MLAGQRAKDLREVSRAISNLKRKSLPWVSSSCKILLRNIQIQFPSIETPREVRSDEMDCQLTSIMVRAWAWHYLALEGSFISSHLIDLTLPRGCKTEISQSFSSKSKFFRFRHKNPDFSFHFKIKIPQTSCQNRNFSDSISKSKFLRLRVKIEIYSDFSSKLKDFSLKSKFFTSPLQNRNFSDSISKSKFLRLHVKIEISQTSLSNRNFISLQNRNFSDSISKSKFLRLHVEIEISQTSLSKPKFHITSKSKIYSDFSSKLKVHRFLFKIEIFHISVQNRNFSRFHFKIKIPQTSC